MKLFPTARTSARKTRVVGGTKVSLRNFYFCNEELLTGTDPLFEAGLVSIVIIPNAKWGGKGFATLHALNSVGFEPNRLTPV